MSGLLQLLRVCVWRGGGAQTQRTGRMQRGGKTSSSSKGPLQKHPAVSSFVDLRMPPNVCILRVSNMINNFHAAYVREATGLVNHVLLPLHSTFLPRVLRERTFVLKDRAKSCPSATTPAPARHFRSVLAILPPTKENRSYESRGCRPDYVVLMKYRLANHAIVFCSTF